MNPIVALVFHFCMSLMSCRSIKYIELEPNKDIFDEQSSRTEKDNQKVFSNQLRFLKILPMNEEWENTIDENKLKSKTKKKNAVPFAIIVATADDNLDKFQKSELKSTYVEAEDFKNIGEEPKHKDKSNIEVEEDEKYRESKLDNDNNSVMTSKNIEEQIDEALVRMKTNSNAGEDDSEINKEKLKSILINAQIKDEINSESQLENIMIPDNDAKLRELLTDISEAKLENEETLHKKEETECKHVLHEVQNDPEGAPVFNLGFGEYSKQNDPCNEHYINYNADDLKSYPTSYVLNKYIFVN